MKILFDTSVLVAAIVGPHPLHAPAFRWLKRARAKEFDMLVAGHTLAELYAGLATLPISPRITPWIAGHLIHSDVETLAKMVSLSPSEYSSVVKRMVDLGLSGGVIYDAIIVMAAKKSRVDHVLTFNVDDFKRVWPEGADRLIAP
ncbi:VapC toxin family PIN domain ribonuclease [Candidatus Methylomirabilis limnetica]|uniref:Ribonuclease VapC n=1 Tax=Candidatus Methylomirabilis limnetica TaxID=2033718 RepID=A0A2T4TWV1_9BACT|nr:PIN domain-containing protein [Candidatus Methylomirabilis limnetica]PTL35580.1 VapC toxin family PIN domain ribonuclease [Candidatus Methylomirabilis limnetica]